ncbi:hypothetical protein OIU77_014117 [Salix suchowensis]|uniref:Uncharacterized protein n=1 Tax=Salix suchowensis TaxID=1278906 RepID=A0ABQ8ZWQ1_9ROSI|nr:hypothetical protein OIU77_014117 [Salix suchowensis]
MERSWIRSPTEKATSLGYVSWEEVYVSSDRGRREVQYYLKRSDGGKDLAITGKEKSSRHMSYQLAIRNRSNLFPMAPSLKPKSRREVIDWLDSIVSGFLLHESIFQAGSLDNSDASQLDMKFFKDIQSQKLGYYSSEFSWLGSPWALQEEKKAL